MYSQRQLSRLQSELQRLNIGPIICQAPMRAHTTWRIGGPADLLLTPPTPEALERIVQYAKNQQIPLTLLGCGSNVLVSDQGIRGFVVQLAHGLTAIRFNNAAQVYAQAGAALSTLAYQAAEHSLKGLAFAEGIPGSVGGAIIMNAGAYGGHISDCLQSVTCLFSDGQIQTIDCQKDSFAYRSSTFRQSQSIILSAEFALLPGDRQAILAEMALYHQKRHTYQPLDVPSAGSVFKNPPGHKAAQLIEAAGAKGWRMGDAQVSPKHCNFIINRAQATCQDVLALMETVQQAVHANSGIWLEREVILLGEQASPTH